MKTDGNGWENHSSFLCSHFVTRNGNGSGNRIARSRDDMGYTDRSKQVNMGGNPTETEEYRTHIDSQSSQVHPIYQSQHQVHKSQVHTQHSLPHKSQGSQLIGSTPLRSILGLQQFTFHSTVLLVAASNHTPHHQFTAWLQQSTAPVHITEQVRKFKSHTNTSASSRELLKESELKLKSSRSNY